MATPTNPYCTLLDVSYWFGKESDSFTNSSHMNSNKITQLINNSAHIIDMRFSQLGYKIPFQPLSDETWPTHQTEYLKILNILGTIHLIKEYLLRPSGNRGDSKDESSIGFESELLFLREISFRADYYDNTFASNSLQIPTGPISNVKDNNLSFQSIEKVTHRLGELQEYFDKKNDIVLSEIYEAL